LPSFSHDHASLEGAFHVESEVVQGADGGYGVHARKVREIKADLGLSKIASLLALAVVDAHPQTIAWIIK